LRVDQAIKLRAAQVPWKDIAEQCGYTGGPGAAHNAVMRELDRRLSKDIDVLREEENLILMELHRAIWPLAVGNPSLVIQDDDDAETRKQKRASHKPSLFAVDRILAIREARRRLNGLDMPTEKPSPIPIAPPIIREYPENVAEAV
jgi:hypothetical protein